MSSFNNPGFMPGGGGSSGGVSDFLESEEYAWLGAFYNRRLEPLASSVSIGELMYTVDGDVLTDWTAPNAS